jgi:hypothetical protein
MGVAVGVALDPHPIFLDLGLTNYSKSALSLGALSLMLTLLSQHLCQMYNHICVAKTNFL